MKYKLNINQFAKNDIKKAKEYYDNIKDGLGSEFIESLDDSFARIEENPNQFQIIKDQTGKANVKRFPFGIYFIVKELLINVFSVMHHSRSPKIWQNREENDNE
jgi:toxin ParE1/3/4